MNLLNSINDFGAIDAENDIRLIEYFYHTQIIDELFGYKKSIIIGRKGSGKTAIYKFIKSEKKHNFSALLFKDYPWKLHDQYKNTIVSARESYVYYSFFQNYRDNIRVFVFLRSDIFNILDFQDKNKIKENMVEFLDWESESTTSKLSLKSLISNRIKSNINSSSDNFERNWNEVFESNNIGKNQFKWNFIIERTFVRPRDVIKFLNLALEQSKARLQANPDTIDKITNEDMHTVRSKYSTYLFEELKDEISSKYPDYHKYLEILRNIHKASFTRDDFLSSYVNIRDSMGVVENSDVVLERLYEFSIIGFYKPGGGGYGGSEYRFQYKSDFQPFNPQAINFKVHSGFKEYLELIE